MSLSEIKQLSPIIHLANSSSQSHFLALSLLLNLPSSTLCFFLLTFSLNQRLPYSGFGWCKGLGCRAPSITVLTWEVSYRYVHIILSYCCCCRLFSHRLLEVCSSSVQLLYTGVVFSIFLTEQHSEAFQLSAELAHGFHPSSKVCAQCHVLHAFCV